MKRIITTSLFCLLTVFLFGQRTEKALTYFNYGKYELTLQSKTILDSLIDKVKSKIVVQIEINGHTDGDGDQSYNKKLSQNRAITVRQYLISKGISNDIIKIQFFGKEQPTATNDNEEGKQKNRRVEIVVAYKEQPTVANDNEDEKQKNRRVEYAVEYKERPFSANREYIQTFKCSPQKEIEIKGEKGTVVKIPPNAFVDSAGKVVKSEVTIEMIEIYTKSDMILNHTQTMSDQRLLETGGMIYIVAISQNKQLALRKNVFYDIEFPTKKKQKDMRIFYGDTTNSNINWQLPVSAKEEMRSLDWESDATYSENKKALNKYIFNSTKMGWINCDRFVDNVATTDLIVNTNDTLEATFCLVFKDINSVMNASIRDGGIKFRNVPIGQTVNLIAFKKKDKEIFYASKTLTIEENQSVSITMEKFTDEDFKSRIKQLD